MTTNPMWNLKPYGWSHVMCDASTTLDGDDVPCGRAAVSVALDAENGDWWPVCVHHTRKAWAVPLHDVLYEAWEQGRQSRREERNPYARTPHRPSELPRWQAGYGGGLGRQT